MSFLCSPRAHGENEKWMTLKFATCAPVSAASYSCHSERLTRMKTETASSDWRALSAILISVKKTEKRYA